MMLSIRSYVILALTAVVISACGVNPVTGEREIQFISEAQEIRLGAENYLPARQSQQGEYTLDPALSRYVKQVGIRLAQVSDRPQLPYDFVVLNHSVPNAWALPGGKIAVNRGLLLELNSEAELAAVLGHEIVHAAARHGAKGMERGMLLQVGVLGVGVATQDSDYAPLLVGSAAVGAALISTKYGRDAELESDRYGMRYMSKAGYDPAAAVELQRTFVRLSEGKRQDWLSGLFASHPPSRDRVAANRKIAAKLPPGGKTNQAAYQNKIAYIKKKQPAYEKFDKAQQLAAKGKRDEALKLIDEAIAIEPREALFYGLRGNVYYNEKKWEKALAQYNQALSRNDNYFAFHLGKGLVQDRLGNTENASIHLERSVKLLPTKIAYQALGDIANKQGETAKAQQYYKAGGIEQK